MSGDHGLDEFYRFRDELVTRIRAELIGPVDGPREVLGDPPMTAYAAAVLHPGRLDRSLRREQAAERDVDLAGNVLEHDEQLDSGVALANLQAPSSAGLSFAVNPAVAAEITVRVEAAIYDSRDVDGNPVEVQRSRSRSTDEPAERWHRSPLEFDPIYIDVLKPGDRLPVVLAPGLELRARVRPEDRGAVAVTVTLVNVKRTGPRDLQDAHCFFQVGLTVSGPEGTEPFVERSRGGDTDDEALLGSLLYRHAPIFAVGHGCAASWKRHVVEFDEAAYDAGPAVAYEIRTDFAPSADVRLTRSNPDIDDEALGMTGLGTWPRARVVRALSALLDDYEVWIERLAVDAERLSGGRFDDLPSHQIDQCRAALNRMRDGVSLLADERDPTVFEAFRLANLAMARQRSRTQWIKDGRSGAERDSGVWRPFQVGFILVNLRGIADPDHPDRGVADVLWFPTGGGKTEAYLGLIAFTVFLRRLRLGERGAGVTVLMRYTLRLLTLQQFQRAATLICAMELIRRADERLGSEPISIGMWVGRAATPNSFKEAAESIRKLRRGEALPEQNPVQLGSCPWCGSPLDADDYEVDAGHTELTISCRNSSCELRNALPVHLVDQGIYAHRPTLVIATADKFAQIAWRGEVASLFNRTGGPAGAPPPELVIQDELHLISGPLGTLVGLYEAAIDLAADRPKIIASTATIRRAREQAGALFDRDVAQFPPAGLDARDSWFATEAPPEHLGSRMFLGLMAPNLSQASLLVRAYGALFHHSAILPAEGRVRDPYWTLIGYFNSLRLLAAAELQVHDDVRRNVELLARRDGVEPRSIEATSELTSRVESSEIPARLKGLERVIGNEALDVVLATNMISVGVDVDRLGLMAVMGQPQMTAEYIQATSRIGRRYPGLAVILYNAARSRDRSHYENFAGYHGALYRQVESTSVTPFAARARDRALHAAFVGAARMVIPAARLNDAAGGVEGFLDELDALRVVFVDRVRRIDEGQADATDAELRSIIDDWRDLAARNPDLLYEAPLRNQYRPQRRHADCALLCSYSDDDLTEAWPTLWSLRDVDVETDLYLGS